MLLELLSPLLPLAAEYVAEQEQFILANGIPLTANQKIDAHQIGVQAIEKVRLYKIDRIIRLHYHQKSEKSYKLVLRQDGKSEIGLTP